MKSSRVIIVGSFGSLFDTDEFPIRVVPLLAAQRVQSLSRPLHDVKWVEAKLGTRAVFLDALLDPRRSVACHELDLSPLLRRQELEELAL
jgi:hypothetical protein